jgi:hypothetical protein
MESDVPILDSKGVKLARAIRGTEVAAVAAGELKTVDLSKLPSAWKSLILVAIF